jgi:type IX secretion system PorP/SprF family membrane protein
MKNLLLKILFFVALTSSVVAQQDASLTQAYANPLQLNPAIMGANNFLKVMVNYKSQLALIDGGYTTSSFGVLYPLPIKSGKKKIDFGVHIQNDKASAFQKFDASFALGYDIKLSKAGNLSFSLIGGFGQKTLNTSLLTFDEQYVNGQFNSANPITENYTYTQMAYGDIGFGLMWYYNPYNFESGGKVNCFVGLSGYHLNSPNKSFLATDYRIPRRYGVQAGIKINLGQKLDVSPNFRLNLQSGMQEIIPGISVDYRVIDALKLTLGSWYRLNGATAFLVGVEYKGFTFGFSHDLYSKTGIGKYMPTAATDQISLTYKYDLAKKEGSFTDDNSPFGSY